MQRFKKAGEGELEMVYLSLSFRFTNESVTQSTYIILQLARACKH